MKLIILYISVILSHYGECAENKADWWQEYRKVFSTQNTPVIWWLRPNDREWKTFKCYEIKHPGLIERLENAKFSGDAGMFLTLDAPFKYSDKIGQGLLILVFEENIIGFKFRSIMEDKSALWYIKVKEFDFKKNVINYKHTDNLAGIICEGGFRRILLEGIDNHRLEKKGFTKIIPHADK